MSAYQHRFIGEASWGAEDTAASSASALPTAYGPDATIGIPRQILLDNPVRPIAQSSSGLGGRQLYSKEQWEAQKPVIFRSYIQENKPFNRVIDILRTGHNFYPTRRQFYRKISDWGFEKNIKDSEMRAIADSLENDMAGGAIELKGRQVGLAKIQRWQKRQARMKGTARSLPNVPADVHMGDSLTTMGGCEPSPVDAGDSTFIPTDLDPVWPPETAGAPQSLDIWTTVDVPGSPLLTRLFEALQIECPDGIPAVSIGSPITATAQSYVADAEIEEIFLGNEIDNTMDKDVTAAISLSSCSSVVTWNKDSPLSYSEWTIPRESFDEWAFSRWDFSKDISSNIELNMGPMRPLSPFSTPSSTGAHGARGLAITPSSAWLKALELDEKIYKSRLNRLKKLVGLDDPRTLEVMGRLATTYWNKSKHRLAEPLLRHIAKSTRTAHGFKHRKTLSAHIDVIAILINQGKYRQAAKICQPVHAAILNLISPGDSLMVDSTISMSRIYSGLSQNEEAERLNRQVLQVRLNTFGPRHRETLFAMALLASVLMTSDRVLDSEQLLSTVVQLQREIGDTEETYVCHNKIELIRVLISLGRFREGKYLATKVAERAEISLAPEHELTLLSHYHVARCLGGLGQWAESESLLQTVLERQLKILGESHPGTINTMYSLAHVLKMRGRCEEAVSHYETCLRAIFEDQGWEYPCTIWTLDKLGQCYERLGRYDDAFALYQRAIDQIRVTVSHDYPAITKINGWIAELLEIVTTISEEVCEEKRKLEVNTNPSNEASPAVEDEADGERKSIAEVATMANEEWMNDFVDFQTPKADVGEAAQPNGQV